MFPIHPPTSLKCISKHSVSSETTSSSANGFNATEEGYAVGDPITAIASASIDMAGAAGSMWTTTE